MQYFFFNTIGNFIEYLNALNIFLDIFFLLIFYNNFKYFNLFIHTPLECLKYYIDVVLRIQCTDHKFY